ncbi:hypothetical protein HPB51_021902 [Rhipicephalus microplus]|uniref:Uncharacterized protein n=1 Tax=Rhipicephalus microplus TaxID=6941 RepID=A0A9J6EJL6_RHIMP|nr:hypothetical protein HPB51_021902 [Rhipicephalus microplus]
MFDWDEGDRFSFEDSDRFEEDSLCSWISEPESLCNNWRGWKRPTGNTSHASALHGGHCRSKDTRALEKDRTAVRESES